MHFSVYQQQKMSREQIDETEDGKPIYRFDLNLRRVGDVHADDIKAAMYAAKNMRVFRTAPKHTLAQHPILDCEEILEDALRQEQNPITI